MGNVSHVVITRFLGGHDLSASCNKCVINMPCFKYSALIFRPLSINFASNFPLFDIMSQTIINFSYKNQKRDYKHDPYKLNLLCFSIKSNWLLLSNAIARGLWITFDKINNFVCLFLLWILNFNNEIKIMHNNILI